MLHSRRLRGAVEYALVLMLLIFAFLSREETVSFHSDESQWIFMSGSFELFVRGHTDKPQWQRASYWNVTQPPIAKYVIALGRLAGGIGSDELNNPWRYGLAFEKNRERGAVPGRALLWWSRLPMLLMAAGSGLILWATVGTAAGRTAGYTFLILYISNAYFSDTLVKAMGDSPLVLFILISIPVACAAMKAWLHISSDSNGSHRVFQAPVFWFCLVGICCGLAGASKLNGLSLLGGGALLCTICLWVTPRPVAARFKMAVSGALGALVLSAGTAFIAVNPFLWSKPLRKLGLMYDHRVAQLAGIGKERGGIESLAEYIQIVPTRIFETYAAISFDGALYLNVILCLIGGFYLFSKAIAFLRRKSTEPTQVVFLSVAMATAIPSLFTPADWDRYYILPVLFSTVAIAVALGYIMERIYRTVIGAIACRRAPSPAVDLVPLAQD